MSERKTKPDPVVGAPNPATNQPMEGDLTDRMTGDELDQTLSVELEGISEDEQEIMDRAEIIAQELQQRILFRKKEIAAKLLTQVLAERGWNQAQWEHLVKITSRPDGPGNLKPLVSGVREEIDRQLVGVELMEQAEMNSNYAYQIAEAQIKAEKSAAKIEQLAHEKAIDPLTGFIRSGDYYTERYNLEVERLKSLEGKCLLVVELDLDDFKKENDFTKDHGLVDEKIVAPLAKLLELKLRFADVKCRMGGDEFTLVLNDVDPKHIDTVAKKIAETVREIKRLSNPDEGITASIGVAVLHQNEAQGAPGALAMRARADHAAYHSKEAGKDKTTLWGPDLPEIKKDVTFFERKTRSMLSRGFGTEVDMLEDEIKSIARKKAAEYEASQTQATTE